MFEFMKLPYFDTDENGGGSTSQPDTSTQTQQEPTKEPPKEEPKQANYGELYKTDKAFQEWFKQETQSKIDKRVTEATETAVKNALEKQKRINDESLSRSERLQAMSDAEKVRFLEEENKQLQGMYERKKEVDELKLKTSSMLTENNIPTVFLDIFNFDTATAEDIQARVKMLSEYEYFEKGEFERLLTENVSKALDEKLKQKPPETHGIGTNIKENDYKRQLDEARKNKDNTAAVRIKKEAFKAGVVLL